jgi:hypothetical protein
MRRALLGVVVAAVGIAALGLAAWSPWDSEEESAAAACPGQPRGRKPQLDLRRSLGRNAAFLRSFDRRAMYPAAGVDAIRSIDRPCFESAEEAAPLLPESSLVIGIERGGEEHAYPIDLLSLHEVVNDVVGGEPVAITWCPLCASGVGYDRRVSGRTLTFGVSGYLYQANLIMFDRETGSLWSQLLGGAVTGALRGESLRRVPITHETWGRWRAQHPDTRVLSIRRDREGYRFTGPYAYSSAGDEESNVPYGTYARKVPIYHPHAVRGVPDASRVYGLLLAGRAKAYPVPALWRAGLVHDVFGGVPILAVYEEASLSVALYSRRIGDRVLTFRKRGRFLVDRETGSRWSAVTGHAVTGPLTGKALARLPSVSSYWFAWRQFFPRTEIWRPTRR